MKSKGLRKFFAIMMVAFILFWSSLPSVSMAFFIKPGESIKNVSPITGVSPMTDVKFMVPGNVYDYGNPITGVRPVHTGQIIIPQSPAATGQFILPNIINAPKYNFLITGNAMNSGNVMTPGDISGGGDVVNADEASSSGNAMEGANPAQTGDGVSGGNPTSGGQGTDGNTITGRDGSGSGQMPPGEPGNGNAMEGGSPGEGGSSPEGNGPAGETSLNPNDGATGGSGPEGSGPDVNGSSGNGGEKGGNVGTVPPSSPWQTVLSILDTAKTYLISYPETLGQILDGTLSMMAGFKLTDLETASGKKNLWRVSGDPTAVKGSGKLSTWLNLRYSEYLNSFENSKAVVRGKGGGVAEVGKDGKKTTRNWSIFQPRDGQEIKQKRIQGFLDEIGPKNILNQTKNYFKDEWIPTNKDFFGKKALAKGSGIFNIVLSVGDRLSENASDPTRTGTDLAAGITTDILLGAGQTAASAAAGWAASAATAAAIGSVVPGVGTIVGAAVGFGLAWFMGTPRGENFSRKVEGVVKAGINKAKDIGKGIVNGLKGLFGG